jgi:hypothetical protein
MDYPTSPIIDGALGPVHEIAIASIAVALLSAAWIAVDVMRRPQRMGIMNVVWPLTGLYAGVLGVWAYYAIGRKAVSAARESDGRSGRKPFWQSVLVGTTHCGSGCTLGDIVAESMTATLAFTVLGQQIFAAWILDYIFALLFGIAFQYFALRPMREGSAGELLIDALKADTLSLTAWQIGMYGWMAIAVFGIFGHELPKSDPTFWFMMQIAMLFGFLTSYPVNWWLLRRGIKEAM